MMFVSQTGYWQKMWFETSNAPLFPLRPPKLHITLVKTKDPISDRIQDMKIRWHWNHHRASHNTNNEMWKTNAGSYLWAILLWHLIKLIPLAGYFATYPDKGIDSETKWCEFISLPHHIMSSKSCGFVRPIPNTIWYCLVLVYCGYLDQWCYVVNLV